MWTIKLNTNNNLNQSSSTIIWNLRILNLLMLTCQTFVSFYKLSELKLFKVLLSTFYTYKKFSFNAPQMNPLKMSFADVGGRVDQRLFKWKKSTHVYQPQITPTHKIFTLFQTFTNFNAAFATKKSTTHAEYKLMFTVCQLKEVKFVNITKIFTRWVNTYNLLTNIFLHDTRVMVFGSVMFKEEICTINWHFNNLNYKFYKYASPHFFLKDTEYGSPEASFFFFKLHNLGLNTLFITDLYNLEKTVHFLRTENFYMVAPVPLNINPWNVSFPIPIFVNNFFAQWFFLKFLTLAQQNAYSIKFLTYNQTWLKV